MTGLAGLTNLGNPGGPGTGMAGIRTRGYPERMRGGRERPARHWLAREALTEFEALTSLKVPRSSGDNDRTGGGTGKPGWCH